MDQGGNDAERFRRRCSRMRFEVHTRQVSIARARRIESNRVGHREKKSCSVWLWVRARSHCDSGIDNDSRHLNNDIELNNFNNDAILHHVNDHFDNFDNFDNIDNIDDIDDLDNIDDRRSSLRSEWACTNDVN